MSVAIRGVSAVVFDAYGTLFDVASAAERERAALGAKWQPLAEIWRNKQLQYTWLRSLIGRHRDFWEVTGDALDFALEAVGIDDPALRSRLMTLYEKLDPYPEAKPVLARLRGATLGVAVLSNGAPKMLEAAVASAGLTGLLDAVLSVEEVGIYKPHRSVYQLAAERLRSPAERIAFVSANGWDAHGGATFGFRAVWCNRGGQPRERLPGDVAAEIRSLSELPELLGLR